METPQSILAAEFSLYGGTNGEGIPPVGGAFKGCGVSVGGCGGCVSVGGGMGVSVGGGSEVSVGGGSGVLVGLGNKILVGVRDGTRVEVADGLPTRVRVGGSGVQVTKILFVAVMDTVMVG